MLVITVLWAATPAIACLVPMHQMTKAEQDCCLKMAQECGSSMMPSTHSCCQGHQHETAVSPVTTYSPTRPFDVAIVPQVSILLVASPSVSLSCSGVGSASARIISRLKCHPPNLDSSATCAGLLPAVQETGTAAGHAAHCMTNAPQIWQALPLPLL